MAGRTAGKAYVYLISQDGVPLYVGKGTGRRAKESARRHRGSASYLERGLTETQAFERERHWIAELQPENNISAGGNGGRCRRRARRRTRDEIEMERVGTKVFAAKFLLSKLDERNCEDFGLSKLDLNRLREVAYGCRA